MLLFGLHLAGIVNFTINSLKFVKEFFTLSFALIAAVKSFTNCQFIFFLPFELLQHFALFHLFTCNFFSLFLRLKLLFVGVVYVYWVQCEGFLHLTRESSPVAQTSLRVGDRDAATPLSDFDDSSLIYTIAVCPPPILGHRSAPHDHFDASRSGRSGRKGWGPSQRTIFLFLCILVAYPQASSSRLGPLTFILHHWRECTRLSKRGRISHSCKSQWVSSPFHPQAPGSLHQQFLHHHLHLLPQVTKLQWTNGLALHYASILTCKLHIWPANCTTDWPWREIVPQQGDHWTAQVSLTQSTVSREGQLQGWKGWPVEEEERKRRERGNFHFKIWKCDHHCHLWGCNKGNYCILTLYSLWSAMVSGWKSSGKKLLQIRTRVYNKKPHHQTLSHTHKHLLSHSSWFGCKASSTQIIALSLDL